MKLVCIFDLQETLISKSGNLLVDVGKLSEVLDKYDVSASLYTINEPWALNQLVINPDLATIFKSIYLVSKKSINDTVWLQRLSPSKTLVVGDGKESELAFAKTLKIPSLDVTKISADLTTAVESYLKELSDDSK